MDALFGLFCDLNIGVVCRWTSLKKSTSHNECLLEINPAMFKCLTTGTAYRKVILISKPNSLLRKQE